AAEAGAGPLTPPPPADPAPPRRAAPEADARCEQVARGGASLPLSRRARGPFRNEAVRAAEGGGKGSSEGATHDHHPPRSRNTLLAGPGSSRRRTGSGLLPLGVRLGSRVPGLGGLRAVPVARQGRRSDREADRTGRSIRVDGLLQHT